MGWLVVIHIEFDLFDAGLGPRVIFCCLPGPSSNSTWLRFSTVKQRQFIRSTRELETALAVASVLVAQDLEPPTSAPAQQVRTEQTSASPVECGDRLPVNDCGPYLGMSLLRCANGNRHRSQNSALPEAVDRQML
jgi:hypothetical protein